MEKISQDIYELLKWKEWTIKFNISIWNLLENNNTDLLIYDILSINSRLVLYKDTENNICLLYQKDSLWEFISKISLNNFTSENKWFYICQTFSNEVISLSIWDSLWTLLTEKWYKVQNVQIVINDKVWLLRIWDENVEVKDLRIISWWNDIYIDKWYNIWLSKLNNSRHINLNSNKIDFLFESLINQQIIIILVTWLEIYLKLSFYENIDINKVDEDIKVNSYFQKVRDNVKPLYEKYFWINISNLSKYSEILNYIKYRHNIIHSSFDNSVLDFNRKVPFFSNKKNINIIINNFEKFVNEIQNEILKFKVKS